jgi:hypothetical protein
MELLLSEKEEEEEEEGIPEGGGLSGGGGAGTLEDGARDGEGEGCCCWLWRALMGFILLYLPHLSPVPHKLVALLLEGGPKARHLPLPAGREVAGIGLWEWRRQLKRCLFCSS